MGAVLLSLEGGGDGGAAAPTAAPAKKTAAPKAARAAVVDDDDDDVLPAATEDDGPVPAASPYVRKVARELGIPLSRVRGSASGARVVLQDPPRHLANREPKVPLPAQVAPPPPSPNSPPRPPYSRTQCSLTVSSVSAPWGGGGGDRVWD